MGYAIAKAAAMRGAKVTLVSGPVQIAPPPFVEVVNVVSAEEMFREVTSRAQKQDIIIKTAAVADYRPAVVAAEKVKKKDGDLGIALERTKDILAHLGANKKEGQFLCGFSMETENMLENSITKLVKKNLDMVIANNLKVEGAGFGTNTNVVTIITRKGGVQVPLMSKDEVADKILDAIRKERAVK